MTEAISPNEFHASLRQEIAVIIQRGDTEEAGANPELFLDPEELVVLGDTVRTRRRAGFDLACAGADCEVGDKSVFALAGAMGDDGGVSVAASEFDGFEGFAYGANLVELDQNRVRSAGLDALGQQLGVGDEEVVADELDFVADLIGEHLPAGPVVLGKAVFE